MFLFFYEHSILNLLIGWKCLHSFEFAGWLCACRWYLCYPVIRLVDIGGDLSNTKILHRACIWSELLRI